MEKNELGARADGFLFADVFNQIQFVGSAVHGVGSNDRGDVCGFGREKVTDVQIKGTDNTD